MKLHQKLIEFNGKGARISETSAYWEIHQELLMISELISPFYFACIFFLHRFVDITSNFAQGSTTL